MHCDWSFLYSVVSFSFSCDAVIRYSVIIDFMMRVEY